MPKLTFATAALAVGLSGSGTSAQTTELTPELLQQFEEFMTHVNEMLNDNAVILGSSLLHMDHSGIVDGAEHYHLEDGTSALGVKPDSDDSFIFENVPDGRLDGAFSPAWGLE